MKKIVVAVDSFKGSMTSLEAGNAVRAGIHKIHSDWKVEVYPVADGGEGTVEALTYQKNVTERTCTVTGPLGERMEASYIWYDGESGQTAVIEMAAAAGLPLVPDERRNPMHTTTYGVGELIRDAIRQGCRRFIIGIGGSATNDAGVGMLQALGYHFYDQAGNEVAYGAEGLSKVADIGFENVMLQLSQCTFQIACDVDNPLVGEIGCSVVYGPQKGADADMVDTMDAAMKRFADLVEHIAMCDMGSIRPNGTRNTPGVGAAGGLGYAFLMFLNAGLRPGIDIVLEEIGLEQAIAKADIVITGEGRLDGQTLMGKTPAGVAQLAKKYGKQVIAVAGCFGEGVEQCRRSGQFDACYAVNDILTEQEKKHAMEKKFAVANLQRLITRCLDEKKVAVLFPGIGYHTDKPLLYYSKKLARERGYEIIEIKYGELPSGVKGDPDKMIEAFHKALQYATEQLTAVEFNTYNEVLFISKSVGTAVAAAYAKQYNINARQIYYTPVAESFDAIGQEGIVFHGTADPWAETDKIQAECEKRGLSLYLTKNANHSMETGNVEKDLEIMKDIMEKTAAYMDYL